MSLFKNIISLLYFNLDLDPEVEEVHDLVSFQGGPDPPLRTSCSKCRENDWQWSRTERERENWKVEGEEGRTDRVNDLMVKQKITWNIFILDFVMRHSYLLFFHIKIHSNPTTYISMGSSQLDLPSDGLKLKMLRNFIEIGFLDTSSQCIWLQAWQLSWISRSHDRAKKKKFFSSSSSQDLWKNI